MDDLSVNSFLALNHENLFRGNLKLVWLFMVKNYWKKRFKKKLVEEEDKLKQEVAEAVRKKLSESKETDSES